MRYLKFNFNYLNLILQNTFPINFMMLLFYFFFRFDGITIALEILPQVGVLIAICTNALRLFLESESPRSRRWYVSLATSCSHVLRTAIPGHIGRRGVHVRPHSEDIRCSTPRWYPPGGGSMADPLRKNTDSSRQGSPPNDGVLVLRFRPIRRF